MKTSNKLLLAFFIATLLLISWFIGTAKYYENKSSSESIGKNKSETSKSF